MGLRLFSQADNWYDRSWPHSCRKGAALATGGRGYSCEFLRSAGGFAPSALQTVKALSCEIHSFGGEMLI